MKTAEFLNPISKGGRRAALAMVLLASPALFACQANNKAAAPVKQKEITVRRIQDTAVAQNPLRVVRLVLDPPTLAIAQFEPTKVKVKAELANGDLVEILNQGKISWQVQDAKVASVLNGTIKGEAVGQTSIAVQVADQESTLTVAVSERQAVAPGKEVERVEAAKTVLPLAIGQKEAIEARSLLKDGSRDKDVLFASDNGEVVSVEEKTGSLERHEKGQATVFVFSRKDARHTQAVQVIEPLDTAASAPTLLETDIASLTISPAQYTLDIGQALQLDIFAQLKDGHLMPYRQAQLQLNYPGIVNLTAEGQVKAVSLGTATVTALIAGSQARKATATFTVRLDPSQGAHVIEIRTTTIPRLKIGEKKLLFAEVFFSDNSTSPNVQWSSSDEQVAAISDNRHLTGLKPGKAIITARPMQASTIQNSFEVIVEEAGQ